MKKRETSDEYWTNLLIDFLTGKITEEEKTLLFEWVEKSEENKLCYTQLKDIWISSGLGNAESPFHKEKAFTMFKERVETVVRNRQATRKKLFIRIAGIAAVLIPFILLLQVGYQYIELKNSITNQQLAFTSIIAPKGAQSQIELPDGTEVWLNAGSSLQYANTFGQGDRNVTLTGEAYFDVTTNKTVPFIVQSGDIQVQVLGTRFNVKAYEQLDNIKIALLEGSVSLQNSTNKESHLLKPMETAIYNRHRNQIDIVKDASFPANGWTNGDIIFNGERFEEIAFMLEQRFNVTIDIKKESLKKSQFKGDFTKNESIERIFNIMATDGQFNYRLTGDYIEVF